MPTMAGGLTDQFNSSLRVGTWAASLVLPMRNPSCDPMPHDAPSSWTPQVKNDPHMDKLIQENQDLKRQLTGGAFG